MTVLDVVGTVPLNGNTSAVIKGDGSVLKNGIGILDSDGKPHVVISVGLSSGIADMVEEKKTTAILVEGIFSSKRIYV